MKLRAPITFTDGTTQSTAAEQALQIVFAAWRSGTQGPLVAATPTKVQINTEESDAGNLFDSTTNFRFQPTTAGWYEIVGSVLFPAGPAAGQYVLALVYKNGVAYKRLGSLQYGATTQALTCTGSCLVFLNGSTDYIELFAQSQTAVTLPGGQDSTFFQGRLAGTLGAGSPAARASIASGGTQTVANTVTAAVLFPSEDYDTDNIHSIASNTSRMTPSTPGTYVIDGFIQPNAAPGAGALIQLRVTLAAGGTTLLDSVTLSGANFTGVRGQWKFLAGDYVEVLCNNASSGATITIGRAALAVAISR